jgi:ubiquitin carboxyl-terminal hydrolase 8
LLIVTPKTYVWAVALEQAESACTLLADETIPSAWHHLHSQLYSVSTLKELPKPPKILSVYPVTYWSDVQIITVGLKNLGNTCYMNDTIQCHSAMVPFARFFTGMNVKFTPKQRAYRRCSDIEGQWKKAVNAINPMGMRGHLVLAFANILYEMSHSKLPHLIPATFRVSILFQLVHN